MSTVAEPAVLPSFVRSPAAPTLGRLSVEGRMERSEREVFARTHRLFRWLLPLQGAWAVALVQWGRTSGLMPVSVAILAAGVLVFVPLALIRWQPDRLGSRLTVAVAQAGFTLLLTALTGDWIELRLHAFASLAAIALYRDWRVLLAGVVAAVLAQGAMALAWPAVFPAGANPLWRAAEGGLWLGLAGAALVWAGRRSRAEMLALCRRQDEYQRLLDELDQRVASRTRQLDDEIRQRGRAIEKLRASEQRHRNLVASAPIGILEATRDGRVRFANPHLLGLIGLPSHFDPTCLSLADGSLFSAEERARLWSRLERDGEVRGFGTMLRHFDGSTFDVVINARLKTAGPDGEVICEGTVEDVTVRKRAERELEALHAQLLVASRQAGMAEVASGVLHNVGNVLTSVNLVVHDVKDRLKTTRLAHLRRVVEILEREKPRLGDFIVSDPTGRQIPEFLAKLDDHLEAENRQLLADVEGLVRHCEHIREIIVTQQSSSQLFGVIETLAPAQLFEDALRLTAESLRRHGIAIERRFEVAAPVQADRHKVLQILVNLVKNAKEAMQVRKPGDRRLELRLVAAGPGQIAFVVADNGAGIAPEAHRRLFQHGFTTKKNGHGFGLHSSVLAAREMGGDLVAASEGPGHGASFTLTLPSTPPPSA